MPVSEKEPESTSAHLAGLAALCNLCFHWSWKKEIFIIWKHNCGPRAGSELLLLTGGDLEGLWWLQCGTAQPLSASWKFLLLLRKVFLEKTLQVWGCSGLNLCHRTGCAQLPNHQGGLADCPDPSISPSHKSTPRPRKFRAQKMDSALTPANSISHLPSLIFNYPSPALAMAQLYSRQEWEFWDKWDLSRALDIPLSVRIISIIIRLKIKKLNYWKWKKNSLHLDF